LPTRGPDRSELRLVDLYGCAPNPSPAAARQKLLRFNTLEMRIETMAVKSPAFGVEGRREPPCPLIKEARELAEGQEPPQAVDWKNRYRGHVSR
jgi:hypothetical protein